jgi:hypothetical protein
MVMMNIVTTAAQSRVIGFWGVGIRVGYKPPLFFVFVFFSSHFVAAGRDIKMMIPRNYARVPLESL